LRGPQTVRKRRGPFVLERIDRSAADLIIAVDGKDAKTADEFLGLVERHEPGEEVILTVIREKREMRISVRLGSSEENSRKLDKR